MDNMMEKIYQALLVNWPWILVVMALGALSIVALGALFKTKN